MAPRHRQTDSTFNLLDVQSKTFIPCEFHPNQPVCMFCSSDGKLICSSCLIGSHRGLEVEEINAAVDRIRSSIDTKVKKLFESKEALQELSENLSRIRTDLRLDSDNKQVAITRATEELRNLLGEISPPPVLSCPVLSCPVLSRLVSCRVVPCLVLCLALSCL